MSAESRLQKAKGFGMMLVFLLVVVIIPLLYMYGMVWFAAKALPWLFLGCLVALAVCLLVLLPLSIFRKLRPWTGLGFFIASYLFGTMLWAFSCVVVVQIWGALDLIIGLFLAGVGVVPVALLATLFHGEWSLLGYVALGTVVTFGTRYFGIRLAESTSEQVDTLAEPVWATPPKR